VVKKAVDQERQVSKATRDTRDYYDNGDGQIGLLDGIAEIETTENLH
jgi:hypothetical protein